MPQKNLRISPQVAVKLAEQSAVRRESQGRIVEAALLAYFDSEPEDRLSDLERRIARLEEMAGL